MGDLGIHRTSHYTSRLNSQSPRMPQQPVVCVQRQHPSPVLVTVGCVQHCRTGTIAFQLLLQQTTRWPNAPHTVDSAWLQCQQGAANHGSQQQQPTKPHVVRQTVSQTAPKEGGGSQTCWQSTVQIAQSKRGCWHNICAAAAAPHRPPTSELVFVDDPGAQGQLQRLCKSITQSSRPSNCRALQTIRLHNARCAASTPAANHLELPVAHFQRTWPLLLYT
jgi:hypothetical protein